MERLSGLHTLILSRLESEDSTTTTGSASDLVQGRGRIVYPRVIQHDDKFDNPVVDTDDSTKTDSKTESDPAAYLAEFQFAPTHNQRHRRKLVDRVFEIHSQTMPGLRLTRERADVGYLETASKLALYGVVAAKVTQELMIGVSAAGLTGADGLVPERQRFRLGQL